MSTKIHATCDALGNPTGFHLTPGQAHDLQGADVLLPSIHAQALLADKAYDAKERVVDKLNEKNITPIIPSKSNKKEQREYDKHLLSAKLENALKRLRTTSR